MKKFLLFALCAISTVSAFAEPFSMKKYRQFKDYYSTREYCYNAEISNETNYSHAYGYINYARDVIYNKTLTKQQIIEMSNKFKNYLSKDNLNVLQGYYFGYIGLAEEALELSKHTSIYISVIDHCHRTKEWNKYWKYSKELLLIEGGFGNINYGVKTLYTMFKYRPKTISKEQQIAFLEQLAQIYPIPGTDFNQWKSFMGFVGFKYKALTGKELF